MPSSASVLCRMANKKRGQNSGQSGEVLFPKPHEKCPLCNRPRDDHDPGCAMAPDNEPCPEPGKDNPDA